MHPALRRPPAAGHGGRIMAGMRASARRAWIAAWVCVCAGLAACAHEPRVLYEGRSAYNSLIVTQGRDGLRTLRFEPGGARQSVVDPRDPTHLALPYLKAALIGLALCEAPRRVLIVGLGGGTLPRFLRHYYPEALIDVVDIDPDVVRVAREYFAFREDPGLRVHVADGRSYVERVHEPYDLVFLDAFDAHSVPTHMTTQEFLAAVRRAVREDGVVVGNLWNSAHNALYAPMVRTYRSVFEAVRIVRVREDVNHIVLALPRAAPDDAALARRTSAVAARAGFGFDPAAALATPVPDEDAAIAGARVLRDPPARSAP